MHRLSRGRFTLGIGRGIAAMYNAFGVPAVTTAQMEDFAQVMRRLWNGEVVFNHDGPIGKYQVLFLDPDFREDIRLAIVAFGPQTLALGGRVFDDVILHTYFTPQTLQRAVKTVKDAAEQAGRDPATIELILGCPGALPNSGVDPRAAVEERLARGAGCLALPVTAFMPDLETTLARFGEEIIKPYSNA